MLFISLGEIYEAMEVIDENISYINTHFEIGWKSPRFRHFMLFSHNHDTPKRHAMPVLGIEFRVFVAHEV